MSLIESKFVEFFLVMVGIAGFGYFLWNKIISVWIYICIDGCCVYKNWVCDIDEREIDR